MIGAANLPRLLQHPLLDLKLGFALMRDRRVPLRAKAMALLMGLAITGVVEGLEIPVESVLAMLVPVLGIVGDIVLDGAEMVAGPLLLANLLLPFVAPRPIVDFVRAERAGGTAGKAPIIDL